MNPDKGKLERRVARLEAVVEASQLLNRSLEIESLADAIVETATRMIGAERGSLFLVDRERGEIQPMIAHGVELGALRIRLGQGIVGTVAAVGEAIILNDPYNDPRFNPSFDRETGFRTRSLLTVPVRDRSDGLVAVLQLLNRLEGPFNEEDVAFLGELGIAFAIALSTHQMHVRIVERERLKEEVRLAGEIQRALQPDDLDAVPGLLCEALVKPSLEVGGDYHDLIPSDTGRWWLVVADVSGKGVSSAMIASNLQSYLWSRRNDRRALERTVREGNDLLYRLARGRKYATMVLAEWHPSSRCLSWVNGGNPPMVLKRGNQLSELEVTGRPLGMLPDGTYRRVETVLEPGDLLLMTTDGLLDAGIERGHEFGPQVNGLLLRSDNCRDAIRRITDALHVHMEGEPPEDDLTVLAFTCLPDEE